MKFKIIIYKQVKLEILVHHKNQIVHNLQLIHKKMIVLVKESNNFKVLKNLNKVYLFYILEID
jgi:hypothetical protein